MGWTYTTAMISCLAMLTIDVCVLLGRQMTISALLQYMLLKVYVSRPVWHM